MRFLTMLALLATTASAQNLTTTFAGGSGQRGNMFDITATNAVVISGFDINLGAGTADIEVYTVTGGGTFVGKEESAAAWTLVGTATGVVSTGPGSPTTVSLAINTPIAAGGTQGFYVTTTGVLNLTYSAGTAVGNIFASDANIAFREGVGKTYPFGTTFSPRIWNGVIHYVLGANPPALPTNFAGGTLGAPGHMFDVTALRSVAIRGFDMHLMAGTHTVEVYAVTGGGTFVGKEATPAAWTLLGSVSGVVGAGQGVPTTVPLATSILVRQGQTQGLYVTATIAGAVRYGAGGAIGDLLAVDTNLQIREGVGIGYPFAGSYGARIWNGQIRYTTLPDMVATTTPLGAACGYQFRSFYEAFTAGAGSANPFDLNGHALKWTFTGNRYVVDNVIGLFVPPPATATIVAAGALDGQQAFTLSAPMPVPGAAVGLATTTLNVCTKGYVAAAVGNGIDYSPTGAELLAFPETTWACWADYDQRDPSSGKILYHESGGFAYATWNGVMTFSDNSATSAFQFQFEVATGDVTLVIVNLGAANVWPSVVGFSPAGTSLDPGSIDISARLAAGTILTEASDRALNLNATNVPLLGGNWNLSLSQIPATGVFGVDVIGLSDPGIDDLTFLGMPLCGLRANLDVIEAWFVVGSLHGISLAVPDNLQLLGLDVFVTTAVFQSPPVNTFGAVTSRGIRGTIGNQ